MCLDEYPHRENCILDLVKAGYCLRQKEWYDLRSRALMEAKSRKVRLSGPDAKPILTSRLWPPAAARTLPRFRRFFPYRRINDHGRLLGS
jgi:hypothetical protein